MGATNSESYFVDLLGRQQIANDPAFNIDSVSSLDPMLVDFDGASPNSFPGNVVVIDNRLPPAMSDASTSAITEVLVISHDGLSDGAAHDPLQAAVRGLSAPVVENVDGAMLEAFRVWSSTSPRSWRL